MITAQSQSFSQSYDPTTKVISAAVCATFVVIALFTKLAVVAVIGAAIILLSYAYSPRRCAIEERSIIVSRLIGKVPFRLDGLREARRATADDFRWCIRLWGSGGLFGYYGLFRCSKLGRCWWYVTNRRNAVVVITGAKTALFSPDNVDGFLAAIRAVAPPVEVSPGDPSPESLQSYPSGGRIGMLIGAAIALVVVAIIAFGFLYSPGPPSYTLTPQFLTINDRFYPVTLNATAVDTEHIQVMDISRDSAWRPVARTNGFANAHYHSGWFRVASGQKVRMYRADGKRLVLLPPKGNGPPVLLETKDPERFVEEVRQLWSDR
jgi:hypothetical protein